MTREKKLYRDLLPCKYLLDIVVNPKTSDYQSFRQYCCSLGGFIAVLAAYGVQEIVVVYCSATRIKYLRTPRDCHSAAYMSHWRCSGELCHCASFEQGFNHKLYDTAMAQIFPSRRKYGAIKWTSRKLQTSKGSQRNECLKQYNLKGIYYYWVSHLYIYGICYNLY